MKFLLFADFHYYPEVFLGCSMPDLQAIQSHAVAEGCDFIIHAGDFCHGPARFPEIVRAYNDFHIPSYHCIGNHDADVSTYEERMAAYGLENDYYYFDCKGYRMIVLNPNYIREDGRYIHYNLKNNQKADDTDRMNPEQIAWLAETIDSAPGSCILISHQSFERPDGAADREEVQRILRAANEKSPGKVLMCINGHYHSDYIRILDGICYFDVNSAAYDWLNTPHRLYPEKMHRQMRLLGYTVIYNEPLHAIVTVEGNTVTIEGMESDVFLGITRAMTGNPPTDPAGRELNSAIQSAKFTLGGK